MFPLFIIPPARGSTVIVPLISASSQPLKFVDVLTVYVYTVLTVSEVFGVPVILKTPLRNDVETPLGRPSTTKAVGSTTVALTDPVTA